MPPSARAMLLAALGLSGCAARSTFHLIRAEQALSAAREAGAEEGAVFQWTMAEEYMLKAREEWGYSDYGVAEELADSAMGWAQKAALTASTVSEEHQLEAAPEVVPEDIAPSTGPVRDIIEPETIDVPEVDDEDPWGEDEP